MYFWMKFSDRARGCVEAPDEATAIELAQEHGAGPEVVGKLAYPADPQLVNTGGCPSFCYRPNDCAAESLKPDASPYGECWPNRHRGRCCCN